MKRLLVALALLVSSESSAVLQTAEVLGPGVPNFVLEFQGQVDDAVGNLATADDRMGFTYHFGIGFVLGPVESDFDIYRRFGPKAATESGMVFETAALSRRWADWIPIDLSVFYGYVAKSPNVLSLSGSLNCIRHGLAVSRTFPGNVFELVPYVTWQADYIFANADSYGYAIAVGLGARPWFLKLVRLFVEAQWGANAPSVSVATIGFEISLVPTMESRSF